MKNKITLYYKDGEYCDRRINKALDSLIKVAHSLFFDDQIIGNYKITIVIEKKK
jgi:hypothetical protein